MSIPLPPLTKSGTRSPRCGGFVLGTDWGYQVFVLGIIVTPHITSQLFVIRPWFERAGKDVEFADNARFLYWSWTLVFNGLCAMIYWNYYLACSTEPGRVPAGYNPADTVTPSPVAAVATSLQQAQPLLIGSNNVENSTVQLHPTNIRRHHTPTPDVTHKTGDTNTALANGTMPNEDTTRAQQHRFCYRCNAFKPPRTHHCSTCKRCVLKMDHHCPWINNCVGHYNHGHFIRFLFYVVLACTLLMITLFSRMIGAMQEAQLRVVTNRDVSDVITILEIGFLCVDLFLSFIVTTSVGILSIYQTIYVWTNTTTIESWERDKVEKMVRKEQIRKIRYPFDVGAYRNICAVLGDRPLLWFWPKPMHGTGTAYPVAKGLEEEGRQAASAHEYYEMVERASWSPRGDANDSGEDFESDEDDHPSTVAQMV